MGLRDCRVGAVERQRECCRSAGRLPQERPRHVDADRLKSGCALSALNGVGTVPGALWRRVAVALPETGVVMFPLCSHSVPSSVPSLSSLLCYVFPVFPVYKVAHIECQTLARVNTP